MKTAHDPRHQHRIDVMQKLFAYSFNPQNPEPDVLGIVSCVEQIDERIKQAAPEWPIEKVSRVDLAILRLATYELAIGKSEPPKVVIDEAVELAKAYGNPTSPSFVNGALGTILKNEGIVTIDPTP